MGLADKAVFEAIEFGAETTVAKAAIAASEHFAQQIFGSPGKIKQAGESAITTEGKLDFAAASSLLDRAANGDKSVMLVNMSQAKTLAAGPYPRQLFTNNLNGCYATAIDMRTPSGTRQVLLTHYGISSSREFAQNIEELARHVSHGLPTRAMIMAPKWHPMLEEVHDSYIQSVQNILRTDMPLKVMRYDLLSEPGTTDIFRTLSLRIPSNIHEPVTYRTWFNHGVLD